VIVEAEKLSKLSRKHLEVLQALARAGGEGLTKEEIAEVVKNRHTAIKIRNDLLRLGLIRINPKGKKMRQKTVESYVLNVNSLEVVYVWQLLEFFEQVFMGECAGLAVDPSGVVIIRENHPHKDFYYYQVIVEVARIGRMLSELHDNLILAQFGDEDREALTNYRNKLREMLHTYLEILTRRALKKTHGIGGESLDEPMSEVVGKLPKSEYIEYIIWQYDNMIINADVLRHSLDIMIRDEEVVAEATEEEKARLQTLYNELTNPAMLRVYQEFLDKRARQPKELIIIPSGGFQSYLKPVRVENSKPEDESI
jgi:hypothetical protein